jgi:prepilin-type N-terminal cleavage/methylation domain-containing protein
MNKKQKGFSLIELLIVVAIILIIAAIAIPNLLRAKIAANQASAVGSLRTISSAEETFLVHLQRRLYADAGSVGRPGGLARL